MPRPLHLTDHGQAEFAMSSGEEKMGFVGLLLLVLRTFYFGKEHEHGGWWDSLAVKSTFYSCRGPRPNSKHPCPTTLVILASGDLAPSSGLCRYLRTCVTHTNTCAYTYIFLNIKITLWKEQMHRHGAIHPRFASV